MLRNSDVHNTGIVKPQYGEGVYVGSAQSNWPKYHCADGKDHSNGALISGNTFTDIPAEGTDIKKGTGSGTLTGNRCDNTGFSGRNSAGSCTP